MLKSLTPFGEYLVARLLDLPLLISELVLALAVDLFLVALVASVVVDLPLKLVEGLSVESLEFLESVLVLGLSPLEFFPITRPPELSLPRLATDCALPDNPELPFWLALPDFLPPTLFLLL